MKIQNISFFNTNSQAKHNNNKSIPFVVTKSNTSLLINSLLGLSLNAQAQISFAGSYLDLEHLKSIKPKVRINRLQKKRDNSVPESFSVHNKPLTKMELNALDVWKYGLFSNNNLQRDFDKGAEKRNLQEWIYIKTLDNLIEKSKPLENECIVYRGLSGSMDFNSDFLNSIEEGMIISHQSYVATATKITEYTKTFLETEAIAIMRIKLPVGTKGILMNKESDEYVLPRGTEIKINSIDKKYGIIDAEYILPEQLPTVPNFVEEYYQKIIQKEK